jgi:CheY-like chemotaxis protein
MNPRPVFRPLFILVVDGHDDNAQSLARVLRSHRHEVFIAHSEEQAERTLLVHPSDVILIDSNLGGENGSALARRLAGQMKKPPLLVGMTDRSRNGEGSRLAGFDRHIEKPVDAAILVELLREHAAAAALVPSGEKSPQPV